MEKLDKLPPSPYGTCALVSLLLPVSVFPVTEDETIGAAQNPSLELVKATTDSHQKRDAGSKHWLTVDDPTYIDAIGVLCGVPDEYKLVNQIASGFENILIWIIPNKNVDRINYINCKQTYERPFRH